MYAGFGLLMEVQLSKADSMQVTPSSTSLAMRCRKDESDTV